jgi:type VI secretion system protein ImpL
MKKNRWKKLLKNPTFWILIVSFVLSLLIIFAAQYLFEPFEQLTLRLLVGLSLFLGTVLAVLAYQLYFKEETQKRLKAKRKLNEKDKESNLLLEKKIKDLKVRFVEATKIIKSSSIYKNKRDTNYELPWYLMVGREQEGKTSLLESSGLEFPLNINYAKRVISEEGTTQSFQWYFAEHAIFVDMPGKYIEQTDNSLEAGVWKAFLKLFRKQRWKRPINGIILTISVDTLVQSSEKDLQEYAKGLRDRFDELSNTFMSTIPIYMFITKTDKVSGFNEYFANLNEDEKNEILGVTFDDRENIDSSVVQPEFDALIERLEASLLDRIHQDWDSTSRTKTLLFCDELSRLFEKINILIDIGFAQTRYRTPLMIRGIYFTSVEQQYTPQTHQQDVQEVPDNSFEAASSKKGLFSLKVLKEVIFPEADIIKMDTSYRQQQKNRHIGAISIALAFVAAVTILWIVDFNTHNAAIKQYEKMLAQYSVERKHLQSDAEFEENLYVLNRLYEMKSLQNPDEAGRFWKLAFYEVDERQEKLDTLYYKSLEKIFLPYIKALIESQIDSNLGDYDLTWASTKAYLMLDLKEHRDPEFMKEWMAAVWAQLYPNKLTVQNNLNGHWQRLIDSDFVSYQLDDEVLKSARVKLLGLGRDVLVYKQLQEKARDMGLTSFQFSQVLGSNTGAFEGNSYVVPGFYTKDGYEKVIVKNRTELIKEIVKSNWVVGYDTDLNEAQLNDLSAKVQNLYFIDYKKHWMKAVNTLQIPYKDTIVQISDQLTVMTSSNSPIVSVLSALKENTLLFTPEEKKMKKLQEGLGKTTQVAAKATQKTQALQSEAQKMMDNTSVKNVREFFEDFHLLLTKENEPSSLLQTAMEKLNKAYLETTAMNGSVSPRRDAFKIVSDRIKGQHAPIVTSTPMLPLPVDNWVKKALQNDWEYIISQSKLYINDQFNTEVYFYYKDKIAGKFPFYEKARAEATIVDFEEFFKKDGVLDQFYSTYITPFVNIDHRNRKFAFRSIDGSKMEFSKNFIYSLIYADEIRKRFFDTKGELLKATMYVTPHDIGRNLAGMSLYYDNNHLNYEHGPIKSRKISWPANSENPNVSFKLYDLQTNEVINVKAEGEWALFRVLGKLQSKKYSIKKDKESVIVGHSDKKYNGWFELSGEPVKVFSKYNPLKNFYLSEDI